MQKNWKDDLDEVLDLADWLATECLWFDAPEDAIRMISEPWKYEPERVAYELWRKLPWDAYDARELAVQAAIEGIEVDDEFREETMRVAGLLPPGKMSFASNCLRLVLGEPILNVRKK